MQRRRVGRAAAAVLCAALALATAGPTAAADGGSGQAAGGSSTPTSAGDEYQQRLDRIMAQLRKELSESSEATLRAAADLRLAEEALPSARKAVNAS